LEATVLVLTIDQVGSRDRGDEVETLLEILAAYPHVLAPERTAGDEAQVLLDDPGTAIAIVLDLTRRGGWTVGCGVGPVVTPLPDSIRAATGGAFISAREAVDRAKRKPTRVAVEAAKAPTDARHLEALLDLLLVVRRRRSAEGWQVHDLLADGRTQTDAAGALGITPQAVSLRAQAGDLRVDGPASEALVSLLTRLNEEVS
jgi:hypothetical protein